MKNKHLLRILLTGFFYSAGLFLVKSQTIPVGTPVLDDLYRRYQLLGLVDSSLSFSIRPLYKAALDPDDLFDPEGLFTSRAQLLSDADRTSYVTLLPLSVVQQFNSAYPYGWNDGSLIPARGYQTRFSAGIYAQYKWFSVQLQPEFVYAQNREYEGFGGAAGPNDRWYNLIGDRIDMPELFGNGSYTRFFPGQSSVRFTLNPVSLGFSTENLWWGPGLRNSVLMSNTAPGFAHITLNTTRPIRTPIGFFEAQVIGGRLEDSGFPPSLLGDPANQAQHTLQKRDDWRYFSGFIATYQPKWLSGLSLGLIRTFTIYRQDMGTGFSDYFPFFSPGLKEGVADDTGEDSKPTDQGVSFFFRWVVPSVQAEVYGEYARNDHPWNFRDLFTQTDHSRAYVVGLRKLIPLDSRPGEHIQAEAEVTQLAATNTRLIRASPTWYVHHQVRHGYTQLGQVLGAGIGPGSNLQSVGVSWVKGLRQVGLRAERFVHNEDFANEYLDDRRKSWVEAGVLAHASWDFDHFIGTAGIQFSHSYNYQYRFQAPAAGGGYWDFEPQDKNNLNLQLGLLYRF